MASSKTRLAALLVLALVAGCGDAAVADFAPPQVVEVGIAQADGVVVAVRRLEITRAGWRVEASLVNRTPATWLVTMPHVRGGTKFGLFVAAAAEELRPARLGQVRNPTPALLATRFRPPLPRILRPGARWSGEFGGPGRIPAGSWVAFGFGRFTSYGPQAGFPQGWITVTRPVLVR